MTEHRPTEVGSPEPALNLGVGFGLYLNGSVYHGSRYSAGEFRSVFKRDRGQRSQFSLADHLVAKSYQDPEMEQAIVRELSRNASLLVNILDLEKVFLSWPRAENAPRIRGILGEEIQLNWSYHHPVECTVELPSMGSLAPAYGAAGLHLESLFQTADGPAPYFPGKN